MPNEIGRSRDTGQAVPARQQPDNRLEKIHQREGWLWPKSSYGTFDNQKANEAPRPLGRRIGPEEIKGVKVSSRDKPIVRETLDSKKKLLSLDGKKEHGSWKEWKKETFDVYAEQVKRLNTLYKTFEKKQGEYRTKESIQEFNAFAKEFNEVHLKACAAQLDSINHAIHLYNNSQPEKLPIQKLPKEVKPISTSWKRAIIDRTGSAVVTGLALTQLVEPVSAQATNALAEANRDGSLREPMYLDHLMKPSDDQHKDTFSSPDAPFTSEETEHHSLVQRWNENDTTPIPGAVLVSQTDIAKVYAIGNSSDVINAAKVVTQTIETDNAYLSDIFGLKPDGLPYTVYMMPNPNGTIGAHHSGCADTIIFAFDTGTVSAEMVEVYQAAINNGWDCGFTNGEALSQVLARERHPELGSTIISWETSWWNQGAHDYISTNNARDSNTDADGCGDLFLHYLHDGLGYDWKTIVHAGGNTLSETYSNLLRNDSRNDLSNDPSTAFQNFKKALEPFVIAGQLIVPEIGESWDSQAKKLKAKIIGGSVGGSVGLIALGGAVYYRRRRRQQRAQRNANQREIELGTVEQDSRTDNPA